jgi:hypothetical protein
MFGSSINLIMFIDDRYENRFNQMRRQHLTNVRYERFTNMASLGSIPAMICCPSQQTQEGNRLARKSLTFIGHPKPGDHMLQQNSGSDCVTFGATFVLELKNREDPINVRANSDFDIQTAS